MSIRKIFIFSLLFSLLFNFFFYYFFESKKALGQGAYCQPLPYLNFGEPWPGSGHLVMTSSTPNVLIKYSGSGLITGTGSSGQVAFWTGSVSIGGNNNLFWDNTNKRLGISTTTPQTSLHVVGNVTADAFLGTINAANVSSGQFGANTGGGNYYFMGNVGIGTTSPAAKLHIFESSYPDGLIIDSPGWPIRRFIQRGGIIVEAFSSYDPNPFYSFKDKIMRVAKPTIDFSNFNPWGKADQWSLRVYGCIYIPTPGSYTFYLTTDDGARFWLNWNLLVDKWIDQGLTTYTVSYSFSSPGWHYIRIDHYENVGGERLLLEWSGPGISRSIISSYYLGICWPDAF